VGRIGASLGPILGKIWARKVAKYAPEMGPEELRVRRQSAELWIFKPETSLGILLHSGPAFFSLWPSFHFFEGQ